MVLDEEICYLVDIFTVFGRNFDTFVKFKRWLYVHVLKLVGS